MIDMDSERNIADLSIVNINRQILPGPRLLHDLVTSHSKQDTAIDFLSSEGSRRSLSYWSLQQLSDTLAQKIKSITSPLRRENQIIPVIIPQSLDLYIAWLAVLKSGAGFCPISRDSPTERLKFIIDDVSASLVLTLPDYATELSSILKNVYILPISIDNLQETSSEWQKSDVERGKLQPIEPASPAYVMYTSGSTGLPKGVKVSHMSVSQSILAHNEHLPTFKRFLQFASPTFDVSIFETFFPFFRGATLVSCERERMLADLPRTIRDLNADAAELTPTVAGTLLRTRAAAPCLELLLTIGEMLTQQVISEFGGSDERESMLYAMYGPTEASIHCTIFPKLKATNSVRSIGRPLATVTALVLQEEDSKEVPKTVKLGQPGELAIAGQLADGYLNRSDQNILSFKDFPGIGIIYRTGDRAICHHDGQLEILGRIADDQVKIRGQRVELGEIEQVVSKISGVSHAIASVADGVLVLFCSVHRTVPTGEIRSICKAWLPPFMRPGEIIMLDKDVPRLPSGKVDRKTLEKDYALLKDTQTKATPINESILEREIAFEFEQELGCPISSLTSLWVCGIDSLKAIKILPRLTRLNKLITVRSILESRNVSELVKELESTSTEPLPEQNSISYDPPPDWILIKEAAQKTLRECQLPSDTVEILPCSYMQNAMLTETSIHSHLNFNKIILKAHQDTSADQIWDALKLIAEQNEILRSGFVPAGFPDMPFVQVVWRSLESMPLDLLHPLQLSPNANGRADNVTLDIHHALYDGWSWDLVMDDLNAILSNTQRPARQSYQRYTSYQQRQTELRRNDEALYWSEQLQDAIFNTFPCLVSNVPQQPEKQTFKQALQVSPTHMSNISKTYSFSYQSIFQATWALVMSIYVDDTDITMGVVTSGRHLAIDEVDSIIGPCLSTLPFRVDLKKVQSCRDLVNYTQRQHLVTLGLQSSSLREIKKTLNLDPMVRLFDTLFVFQPKLDLSEREWNQVTVEDTFDNLDYTLIIEILWERDRIFARLTSDSARISKQQAEIILTVFDNVVSQLTNDLEASLDQVWDNLAMNVLSVANEEYEPFQNTFDLTTTILRLAQEAPTKVAVEFIDNFDPFSGQLNKQILTYSDLFEQATLMSRALHAQHGNLLNQLICVIAEKSLDVYIAILAATMTGGGYLCIEPGTPVRRANSILNQANCKLVLIGAGVQRSEYISDKRKVQYIKDLLKLEVFQPPNDIHIPTQDDLAYAVFTSGSTGVPKGVLLTRKNILSNIYCLSQIYDSEPTKDRLLQACSLAFDVSAFEIFWTWHMGMTICSASNDVLFRDLNRLIDLLGITHLSMTPSVASLVNRKEVPQVKLLVTAGEPMNSKVFNDWADRGLYQGYGPSETTNICNVRPDVALTDGFNNVGPPLPSTSIFVCQRRQTLQQTSTQDEKKITHSDFRLVPKGAVGEIWIGGEQVVRGYIDPDLTASSFLRHPRYRRLYRSGDIGRLLVDGTLAVLGREDDQIKLRGQRIELGDINSMLCSVDIVNDASTLILPRNNGRTHLVSFWTSDTVQASMLQQMTRGLFEHLQSNLPRYMLPDMMIRVERITLTKQGKVDKGALRRIYESISSQEAEAFSYISQPNHDANPLTESEASIADAISRVLKIPSDTITSTSSFYALGLDSIASINLSQELRKLGYSQIDVSTILRNPSIKKLLEVLQHGKSKFGSEAKVTLATALTTKLKSTVLEKCQVNGLTVQKILPCTALQVTMLASHDATESSAYQNTLEFIVNGDLDKLKQVWLSMLQRHELLRTRFMSTEDPDEPFIQVILGGAELPWYSDHSDLSLNTEVGILEQSPYCFRVMSTDLRMPRLVFSIHHALYDAEAMSVLLSEVQAAYHGDVLAPSVSFDKYLEYMMSMAYEDVDEFWRTRFVNFRASRLTDVFGIDHTQASNETTKISSLDLRVTIDQLENFSKSLSITSQSVLQCTIARLLSHYLQASDVCFGNVFSGRDLAIEGINHVVGPCFNTLPLRMAINDSAPNREIFHKFHQINLETIPLQPSSLRRIQRQNSSDGIALFDAILLVQHTELKLDSSVWELHAEYGDMGFPLVFEVILNSSIEHIVLKIHSTFLTQTGVHFLAEDFNQILFHCVQFPQARAADFSFLPPRYLTRQGPEQTQENPYQKRLTGLERNTDGEPWTKTELLVKDVLAKFCRLDHPQIEKSTSVFQLGLDSINAVQIAAELRKRGYEIVGSDILELSTLSRIAHRCEFGKYLKSNPLPQVDLDAFSRKLRPRITTELKVQDYVVESIRPCTVAQCGMLSHFIRSEGTLYLNSTTLRLQNDVDPVKLKSAWQSVTKNHEMLRTGFAEVEDASNPFAMITYTAASITLPWSISNESDIDASFDLDEFGATCSQQIARPAWRLRLLQQGSHNTLEISILHALYDAQSLNRILEDVVASYNGTYVPSPAPLSGLIEHLIALGRQEAAEGFWKRTGTDITPTKFPDLRVYRISQSGRRQCVESGQSTLSLRDINAKCAEIGVTLQMLGQAVWSRLLAGLTSQSRVCFGLVLSGRNFKDDSYNSAIFPCISTVPCVIETRQDLPNIFQQIREFNTGAMQYSQTPMTSIKRWWNVEDELFDTVLVLQNNDLGNRTDKFWSAVRQDAKAEFSLSLELIPTTEDNFLQFQLTVDEHSIPKEAAAFILQQFDALLAKILDQSLGLVPKLPLEVLSIIPPKDERIENETRLLHELVNATVKGQPSTIALEFVTSIDDGMVTTTHWTYDELDLESNRIAHMIMQFPVHVGDLVAVHFDKCPDAYFSILGVLKAGCAYVAIDPGAPEARKEFILNDSDCKIVLTTSKMLDNFRDTRIPIIAVDDQKLRSNLPTGKPLLQEEISPQSTCYCLYTSGTTGTPKGCLISHDSAVQAMLSFQRIFQDHWDDQSRWLQFASFHFDVSVLELFWSWSVGIRVTSIPREILFDDLPGTLRTLNITHLDLTPSLARILSPEEVPSLCRGVFIVGGEQVSQDIIETWGDSGCLYNFYGPSEVTIGCTVHKRVPKTAKPTNIGQQWDNVGAFVLEPESQHPVLRGAIGELCLSGPLVAKGYLNRPQLTEAKFVWLEEFNIRIYRTGDLVRLLHDNSFEFLGRIDDQVKLRGQRLEIGEINHCVSQSAREIKDVTTMVLKHPQQEKEQLVAFIAVTTQSSETAIMSSNIEISMRKLKDRVKSHCIATLPGYMVPTTFLALSTMPLSTNNKIDPKILKNIYENLSIDDLQQLSQTFAEEDSDFSAEIEGIIDIVASFLKLPPNQIYSNSRLFELGLDSISIIGLSHAFRRQGFKQASLPMLMKYSIIKDLAGALHTGPEENENELQSITASKDMIKTFANTHENLIRETLHTDLENIESIAPCTPLQEAMIAKVMSSNLDDHVYFTQFTFEIDKNVDLDRLSKAWKHIQRTNGILRTHFISTPAGFAQVVLRFCDSGVSESRTPSVQKFKDWVKRVRSLSTAVPWKVQIIPTWGKTYMTIFIFHGLYDGTSLPYLLQDVAKSYREGDKWTREVPEFYTVLPYGPLNCPKDAESFWKSKNISWKSLNLQKKYSSEGIFGKSVTFQKHMENLDLQHMCSKLNVTIPAAFQASWFYTLHQAFQVVPTIGIVVSGRTFPIEHAERVIGPMFNTIPFDIPPIKEGSNLLDLIIECHQFNIDALRFQTTSLRDIVKWSGSDTSHGLFDNLFVFQKESKVAQDHKLWRQVGSESTPDYPLNLEIEHKIDDSFVITIVTKPEFLNAVDARNLAEDLLTILEKIGRDEKIALPSDFSIIDNKNQDGQLKSQTYDSAQHEEHPDVLATPLTNEAKQIRNVLARMANLNPEKIQPSRSTIFELGLDSIDALRISAELKQLGIKIGVQTIMQYPTVKGMSQRAKIAYDAPENGKTRAIEAPFVQMQDQYTKLLQSQDLDLNFVERILPVTLMQEGLLIEYAKYYNIMNYVLEKDTDSNRLLNAWKQVIETQPILRTRFVPFENEIDEAGFLQVIMSERSKGNFEFEVFKTGEDATNFEKQIQSKALEAGPEGPNLRLSIIKRDNRNSRLVLGLHHATYDAWSLNLLHRQVEAAYTRTENFDSLVGEDNTVQYEAHLQTVIEEAQSPVTKAFWAELLTNAKPSVLKSFVANSDHRPCFYAQNQSKSKLQEVLSFCRSNGITLQSLGLTCWTMVLAHLLKQLDVSFGVVLSGRTTEGSESIIFPTFNTVIFRTQIDLHSSRETVLKNVHELAIQISHHQHFPLKEAKKLQRSISPGSELFNTLFTFQKMSTEASSMSPLYREIVSSNSLRSPPYAINIELEGRDGQLWWTAATQENILNSEAEQGLIQKLDFVLLEILKEPNKATITHDGEHVSICGLPSVNLVKEATWKDEPSNDDSELSITTKTEEWSEAEKTIRDVLAELSGTKIESIKKYTSIFNVGLDSISAIKMTSILKRRGFRLPVSQIINLQTVEKMAAAVESLEKTGNPDVVKTSMELSTGSLPNSRLWTELEIDHIDIESTLPATAGQIFMLDMWTATSERLFYSTFWLEIGGISADTLIKALGLLKHASPMLRTKFLQLSSNGTIDTLQMIFNPEASSKYDLPWSYNIQQHDEKLLLILKIHHALYDAVSLQLLVSQLQRLCQNPDSVGKPSNTDFQNFIAQTGMLQDQLHFGRKHFWKKYLSRSTYPTIPKQPEFSSERIEKYKPRILEISKLMTISKKYGLSIQSIFFAACARIYSSLILAEYSTNSDIEIVLGIYLANRSLDIDNLPELNAPTFNVVPLKIRINKSITLFEMAKQIQSDLAEISKALNCEVNMRDIYQWTGVKIDCYVNFLKLPQDIESKSELDNGIKIKHADQNLIRKVQAESQSDTNDNHSPFLRKPSQELESKTIQWCLPSIDIEAKIESVITNSDMIDGHDKRREEKETKEELGIGIFVPEDILDENAVDEFLLQLKQELLACMDEEIEVEVEDAYG